MKIDTTENYFDSKSSELFEHRSFVVGENEEPIRIDTWTADHIEGMSRNRIQQAAKIGCLRVNDQPVKSNYKVQAGDKVSLSLPTPVRDKTILPEDIPLDIRYEDDDLIVLHKPAGLVVHPGSGNHTGTLCNALAFHTDQLAASPTTFYRPGIVHRIDKDTTGLMVIAKNEDTMTHLAAQFAQRSVHRRYYALVWGDLPDDEGTITGNIGRHPRNRKLMHVFEEGEEYGKHAVTHYTVVERFGYMTLVECRLETGRTHQIRVHFKHIGHALFNDATYGGDRILKGTVFSKYKQFVENCFKLLPRQALHAKQLGFEHPRTHENVLFDSDLPEDMQLVIERWRKYHEQVSK